MPRRGEALARFLNVCVSDGGKVAPPGDGGCAEGSKVFVNDCEGSGQRPAGEANACERLVMLDQASKGPHGRGNVVADAVNETSAHGEEESGGGQFGGGGSRPVRVALMESRVPLG